MEIMNQLREVVDKEDTIDLLCQSSIDFICRDNLSKGLRYASEKKANFAIIIGQEEILNKEVTIKDLKKRAQKKIEIKDLKDIFH